jgi:hypothetical protein
MREAVFILAIVAVLVAITAVRYRRQISAAIGFYKEIKKVRSQLNEARQNDQAAPQPARQETLVCCQKCRKWVPESGAVKFGRSVFYCSRDCMSKAAAPAA